MHSAVWDRRAKCNRRFWRACGAISFCVGTIILPALAVADATGLLCCRDLGGTGCRQAMALSVAESGLAELGAIARMASVDVSASGPNP